MKVTNLKTENLIEPMGIAEVSPRFSWQCQTHTPNYRQQSYRLEVSADNCVIWDSDDIQSEQSVNITGCPRLKPLTVYRWRVRVDGKIWSHYASFETGMLNRAWQGQWIAGIHNGEAKQPVNYLRKSFSVDKNVTKARLYATALGVYTARINGQTVSPDCFAPGWTDYFFRVQHQTYDVTKLVSLGENALGILLGDGWYCGTISRRRNDNKPSYGDRPVFRCELHLYYTDGTREIIGSDDSFRCSIGGPLRFSDIFDGEYYDSRYDLGDWDKPGYFDQGWTSCLLKNRRIRIVGACAPPVRRTEFLPIKRWYDIDPKLWTPEPCVPWPERLTVVDFGQNITGREILKIQIPAGQKVTIKHGEVLHPDGTVCLHNFRTAMVTSTIVGNGQEITYEPEFTFFGFRYLQISNCPENFAISSIRAAVIHSDLPRTGDFSCSNELVNQLYNNQLWSNRDNYLDIPTDCPQRDERLGWLGDAQIFVNTASYNFDICGFFSKFLADVNSSRTGFGEYPQYAPFFAISHLNAELFGTDYYKGHSGWADAALICPWNMYVKYGDQRILARYYENMKEWIRFQETNSDGLLRESVVWRDWLNQDSPTSEKLISTAFFAYGTSLMAKIAKVLGQSADAAEFTGLAARIRQVFADTFLGKDGLLVEQSQTAALLTLYFDLLQENARAKIAQWLAGDIEKREHHLTTGFLGTPYLLPVLVRFGYPDIAGKLLEQTTFPSWLYPVTLGATTIWERWDGMRHDTGLSKEPMNSFNHYAYGSVAEFMYEGLGGIRPDEQAPGFKHFFLQPVICGSLSHAEVKFASPYGLTATAWTARNGTVTFTAEIPANTTATLTLPGKTPEILGSGNYQRNFQDPRT